MFCPNCGAEYRPGFSECADCGVALVETPPEPAAVGGPLVEIFRTADVSLLPVVKSVLGAADIPFSIQGDEASGLFPLGSMGGGSDRRDLGAVVWVPEERREEAERLLAELEESGREGGGES